MIKDIRYQEEISTRKGGEKPVCKYWMAIEGENGYESHEPFSDIPSMARRIAEIYHTESGYLGFENSSQAGARTVLGDDYAVIRRRLTDGEFNQLTEEVLSALGFRKDKGE